MEIGPTEILDSKAVREAIAVCPHCGKTLLVSETASLQTLLKILQGMELEIDPCWLGPADSKEREI